MKFVVKLGGAALEKPELLQTCARSIAELVKDGHKVALVHGGGVQLTKLLTQMGKKSEFVAGLRITDAETRDAAIMVLGGRVNKSLVAALDQCNQSAVGLTGGDGHVFRARKKKTEHDNGFVGEIAATDPKWLDAIWAMGAVPVISSIALGFDGEYYNINADEMASAAAVATKADALVFLNRRPRSERCRRQRHALALAQGNPGARKIRCRFRRHAAQTQRLQARPRTRSHSRPHPARGVRRSSSQSTKQPRQRRNGGRRRMKYRRSPSENCHPERSAA